MTATPNTVNQWVYWDSSQKHQWWVTSEAEVTQRQPHRQSTPWNGGSSWKLELTVWSTGSSGWRMSPPWRWTCLRMSPSSPYHIHRLGGMCLNVLLSFRNFLKLLSCLLPCLKSLPLNILSLNGFPPRWNVSSQRTHTYIHRHTLMHTCAHIHTHMGGVCEQPFPL